MTERIVGEVRDTTLAPRVTVGDVLRVRDFRLLWAGEAVSILGDQFHMIALPWLVLQLTGDSLAMGTVLALAGVPRAIFMLVGGAVTDRFSPRSVMLASNLARMLLVALLALLTITGAVQLWMLYVMALAFGIADAFFFPAQSSMVPLLLRAEQLQAGNAIIHGTAQLALMVGPVLAGVLIAALSGAPVGDVPSASADTRGIGLAFAFDSLSFAVSAFTLWRMRAARHAGTLADAGDSMLGAIREMLAYVWRDPVLRGFFLVVAALNVLINGPFNVGIPVLADRRLAEGAAALGAVMSAFGGGALLGMGLAGLLPKPPVQYRGAALLVLTSLLGVGLTLFGGVESTLLAALVALAMGVVNGYVNINFITWLQLRVPTAMLGRVMSLLMIASVGLNPISNAVSGAMAAVSLPALFVGAGTLMALVSLVAATQRSLRAMAPSGD